MLQWLTLVGLSIGEAYRAKFVAAGNKHGSKILLRAVPWTPGWIPIDKEFDQETFVSPGSKNELVVVLVKPHLMRQNGATSKGVASIFEAIRGLSKALGGWSFHGHEWWACHLNCKRSLPLRSRAATMPRWFELVWVSSIWCART
jgi:hypothetical protein